MERDLGEDQGLQEDRLYTDETMSDSEEKTPEQEGTKQMETQGTLLGRSKGNVSQTCRPGKVWGNRYSPERPLGSPTGEESRLCGGGAASDPELISDPPAPPGMSKPQAEKDKPCL
ncbi:hypothetical protein Y1Q_0023093 [Alligator mississippiensis]|uniref:Uncharacterized protein n=1 Tax=Alligator mississippiensis TaxID=8496 RepID=A0A151NUW8_ALLMI|nr:hypothetical protein Y1Q_0023093 [Alligator mississippiensis]